MIKYSTAILLLSGMFFLTEYIYPQVYFSPASSMLVRVDDYGAVRVYSIANNDTIPHFDRSSILVSGENNEVFDYWKDIDIAQDVILSPNPDKSDYEITGKFNNSYSGLPPNVLVDQSVYGWNNGKFIICRYNIKNAESTVLNSSAGLDIVAGVDDTYEDDTIRFNTDNQVLYMYDQTYLGFKILNSPVLSAHIFEWYEDYETSDENYYRWMTSGVTDSALYGTDEDGGIAILSGSLHTLAPNDSFVVYFAIALGDNEADMLANLAAAEIKYNGNILPVELASYTAVSDNGNVILKWQTATEINNKGFEILRNDSTIAFVEGKGTTTQKTSYSYTDFNITPGKYTYILRQIDYDGTITEAAKTEITITNLPKDYSLEQNYPNPFNPSTTIKFSLPVEGMVTIKLYNSLGEEVKTLMNSFKEAGIHSAVFNFSDVPSGLYFYRIESGSFSAVKKMTLIK